MIGIERFCNVIDAGKLKPYLNLEKKNVEFVYLHY